jgi:hypothetical protein
MINYLNRKKLMCDSSPEELARVKASMKNAGIPFTVKTIKSRGILGMSVDSKVYGTYNQPYADRTTFVYYLYVRKKDYNTAYETAYSD